MARREGILNAFFKLKKSRRKNEIKKHKEMFTQEWEEIRVVS